MRVFGRVGVIWIFFGFLLPGVVAEEVSDKPVLAVNINDDGTVLANRSGKENKLEIPPSVIVTKEMDENALRFNGTPESRLQIPNPCLTKDLNELSVAFWFKAEKFPEGKQAGENATILSINWNLEFRLLSDGRGHARIENQSEKAVVIETPFLFRTGEWNHVAYTYSVARKRFDLYVNGLLVDSKRENISGIRNDLRYPLILGGSPGRYNPYNGMLSDIRIYGKALSEKDIADLFKEKTIGGIHPVLRKQQPLLTDIYEKLDPGETFQESMFIVPSVWPPTPDRNEKNSGMIAFVATDPGEYIPSRIPRAEERINKLSCFLTPGEYEPLTFAVYGLEELADFELSVECSDFPLSTDKRYIYCWPQRTGWKSRKWYMAPEMLLPFGNGTKAVPYQNGVLKEKPFTIDANETCGFWLTFHADETAKPGKYSAVVKLKSKGKQPFEIPLEVEVLPFKLRTPSDKYWPLYFDSWRWQKMNDEQIMSDIKDFARHGINSLVGMPFYHCSSDKFEYDMDFFAKINRFCKDAGINGPFVSTNECNYLPIMLNKSLGLKCDLQKEWPEQLKKEVLRIMKNAVDSAKARGLDWYFYGKDEPKPDDFCALQMYQCAKEAGAKTHATASNHPETVKNFKSILSIVSVSGCQLSDSERTEKLKKDLNENNTELWYYATGCYVDPAPQEKRMIYNRYGVGMFLWKTGALAAATWTFCRPKEDAFNDFDGSVANKVEPKDSCIVYPHFLVENEWSTYQGAIPTIAWESIREGIDDFKYLHTLDAMLNELDKDIDPGKRKLSARIRGEFKRLCDAVPWNVPFRNWNFDTRRLQSVRKAVSDMIIALKDPKEDDVQACFRETEELIKTFDDDKNNGAKATAIYSPGAPACDGKLDDACWSKAPEIRLLPWTAISGRNNLFTTGKLLWDDDNIYVGFYCKEPFMKNIKAMQSGHDPDKIWQDDCVEIFIGNWDNEKYVHFIVNTNNGIYDEAGMDKSWDSASSVAVAKGGDFWSVEITIPWKTLYPAGVEKKSVMRANLCRSSGSSGSPSYLSQSWRNAEGAFHFSGTFGKVELVK